MRLFTRILILSLAGCLHAGYVQSSGLSAQRSSNAGTEQPVKAVDTAPLRIAVAGVSHGHLSQVARRIGNGTFEVVGVWEENDAYRQQNALTGKVAEDLFYSDLGRMLDETKPEAVVAYGPIFDHLRVVQECAPRGIHVMVEKPLAVSVKHARQIEALAKRYGTMVLTNYETSWYRTNQAIPGIIREGTIGPVHRIEVYDGHQGPVEIKCAAPFLSWLCDPVLNGGGAVTDFGCYGANLATWLLGGEEPVRVSATLRTNKPSVYPKVDDDATILVDFPSATVVINASWCWPMNRKDMYVYGSKGWIYQENSDKMYLGTNPKTPAAPYEAPALEAPFNDSFLYLRAAVRGEITVSDTDLASLQNNLIVVRILEAAKRSAASGRAVRT